MASPAPPRIAWFTPLRPVESGISLYSEEILAIVGDVWPIDVFVDGYHPTHLARGARLRVFPAKAFRAMDRRERYATVVYQMGNSPAHAYMHRLALERPGILVLHDTLLHHLVQWMLFRRRGGVRHYRELMTRRYGTAGKAAADRVAMGQAPSSLFNFPLSEDVIEAAKLVVVHSEFSRLQVLSWCFNARVLRVPMGIRLPQLVSRRSAREALGVPDDVFLLASVTMVNPHKRIDVVLRAVQRLRNVLPIHMLVAGAVSPHMPLDRLISLWGLDAIVARLGFVSDAQARLIVAASDVCVNLRYPTAGETSASLLRTMAAGRPVLVSDAGSFRELPDAAVIKIPVDALEEETVVAVLQALAMQPDLADRVGRNARQFVETEHSIQAMVRGYRTALRGVIGVTYPEPAPYDDRERLAHNGAEVATEPQKHRQAGGGAVKPLIEEVGTAIGELGLGPDAGLLRSVAQSMSELHLGIEKPADRRRRTVRIRKERTNGGE